MIITDWNCGFSKTCWPKGWFRRYDFCLLLSCATSVRHDFRPSPCAQFSLTTSTMCRTNIVGLIYTTQSDVKSWRILVVQSKSAVRVFRSSFLLFVTFLWVWYNASVRKYICWTRSCDLSFSRHFFVTVKFQWRIGRRCLLRSRFLGSHARVGALRDDPKNGCEGD